jgi:hypothetical protein
MHISGILGKLLLSFSVYTNAPKILNTSQPKGTLTCVNGIRFLSMTWVILGHTYGFGAQSIGMNINFLTYMLIITHLRHIMSQKRFYFFFFFRKEDMSFIKIKVYTYHLKKVELHVYVIKRSKCNQSTNVVV